MGRTGDFIDVHVTRAQKVVALIVAVIALIGSVFAGVSWVKTRFSAANESQTGKWQAEVTANSAPDTWGPNRRVYTKNDPPTVATINSITDSAGYGDERNFMRIRDLDKGQDWSDSVEIRPGGRYEISILFRNDALTQAAKYPNIRAEIPAIVLAEAEGESGTSIALAHVYTSNTVPTTIYDSVTFINRTQADAALRYVKGTARLEDDSATRSDISVDALVSEGGLPVGSIEGTGDLPPGYSGRLFLTLVADQPGFLFETTLRLKGTDKWVSSLEVSSGDIVEFRLAYANTGTTEQRNVVLTAVWPSAMKYSPSTSELVNSNSPNGKDIDNSINGRGMDIGNYAAGANAYMYFEAVVQADACGEIKYTAGVETRNGNKQSTAMINVTGEQCASG